MLKDEGNGGCIQSNVDRVERRAGHGNGVMGFKHFRNVGADDGHGIPLANTPGIQCSGHIDAASKNLTPAKRTIPVTDGGFVAINHRGPTQH